MRAYPVQAMLPGSVLRSTWLLIRAAVQAHVAVSAMSAASAELGRLSRDFCIARRKKQAGHWKVFGESVLTINLQVSRDDLPDPLKIQT